MKLTHRVLRNQAKPVDFRYPVQNQMLADNMFRFMREEKGIGLAAPQIGISKKVFVMEIEQQQRACFNPEITEHSQNLVDYDEGCLSFPGDQCTIKRPEWIKVRYQDPQGEWLEERLSGLWARCFQHELDHLDGVTMWDRHKEQNAKQS